MPATRTSTSTRASSNREASSFNLDRFLVARNDATRPYPSETDIYRRSTIHNPDDDGFFDVGLCDFLVANRRVARRRLDHLSLTPHQSGLLSRGAQHRLDLREPYNMVLEASLGYAPVAAWRLLMKSLPSTRGRTSWTGGSSSTVTISLRWSSV